MPDAFVKIRAGEKRPVYGQVTAQSGTLKVAGAGTSPTPAPDPVVTLYDAGNAAVDPAGTAVTGYDTAVIAAPRAWLNLDTVAGVFGILLPGFYTLKFGFWADGSDGIRRFYEPTVRVKVMEATE